MLLKCLLQRKLHGGNEPSTIFIQTRRKERLVLKFILLFSRINGCQLIKGLPLQFIFPITKRNWYKTDHFISLRNAKWRMSDVVVLLMF